VETPLTGVTAVVSVGPPALGVVVVVVVVVSPANAGAAAIATAVMRHATRTINRWNIDVTSQLLARLRRAV